MKVVLSNIFEKYSDTYSKLYLERVKNSKYSSLTVSQIEYLNIIKKYWRVQISDLAESLSISKASASIMIKKLEGLGLVKREQSSKDKRVYYISLTKEAIDFINIDKAIFQELMEDFLKNLNTYDKEQLKEIVSKGLDL